MQPQFARKISVLVHDLAGPVTALAMTLPELQESLPKNGTKKSREASYQLCQDAVADLRQKLKKLWQFIEAEGTLLNENDP